MSQSNESLNERDRRLLEEMGLGQSLDGEYCVGESDDAVAQYIEACVGGRLSEDGELLMATLDTLGILREVGVLIGTPVPELEAPRSAGTPLVKLADELLDLLTETGFPEDMGEYAVDEEQPELEEPRAWKGPKTEKSDKKI